MIEPRWSAHNQKWSISIYSGSKRVKTFWSGKPGLAGKREVLKKYNDYINGTDTNITVAAEWSRYLDSLHARMCPEAFRNVASISEHHILSKCGKRKLTSMRLTDWQQVINSCEKVDGGQLSKKSLRTIRATIVQFLKYCEMDGIDVPSGAALYAPKNAPTVGKEIIPLQAVTRLFDPSEPFSGDYFIHLFRFMCVTGLRPGEALGLTIDDIQKDRVVIRRSVSASGRITEGKNENARRMIPIGELAKGILRQTIARNEAKNLRTKWIFCSPDGSMGNQSTMRNHWAILKKERGIPGTVYSLRHTFISMMKNVLPEQSIKDVVGHSVSFDSFGTYGHILDGEDRRVASVIDLTFGQNLGQNESVNDGQRN